MKYLACEHHANPENRGRKFVFLVTIFLASGIVMTATIITIIIVVLKWHGVVIYSTTFPGLSDLVSDPSHHSSIIVCVR